MWLMLLGATVLVYCSISYSLLSVFDSIPLTILFAFFNEISDVCLFSSTKYIVE